MHGVLNTGNVTESKLIDYIIYLEPYRGRFLPHATLTEGEHKQVDKNIIERSKRRDV